MTELQLKAEHAVDYPHMVGKTYIRLSVEQNSGRPHMKRIYVLEVETGRKFQTDAELFESK